MLPNCRSNAAAVPGAIAPAAAAVATGARASCEPFALSESWDAAEVIWAETNLPREIAMAGIVFDMMPGHRAPRRAAVAKRLRVRVDAVRSFLLLWECTDESVRFEAVRRAVAVARIRRLSRGCKSCRG